MATDKDRLLELRKKQLESRDPGTSKIPGYDWQKHSKRAQHFADIRRREENRFWLVKVWDLLPTRYRGAIVGVLLGGLMALPLSLILPPEWQIISLIPLLVAMIVGMVIGKALQKDPY